jgi:hypothetical protein
MRFSNTRAVIVAMLAIGSACVDRSPYAKCIDSGECITFDRRDGRCLNSMYGPFCAFPDNSCPTMWRWDSVAYPTFVNQCVDPSVTLDAAIDPPADMSTGS